MSSTTFEEARRCPRCGNPGEEVSRTVAKGARPGTLVAMVYCRTGGTDPMTGMQDEQSCRWYNTGWPVQINPDGTVPIVDHSRTAKEYPQLLPTEDQNRLIEGIVKQVAAETQPGGAEVRNPRSPR